MAIADLWKKVEQKDELSIGGHTSIITVQASILKKQ
jgi:hypothetical protein